MHAKQLVKMVFAMVCLCISMSASASQPDTPEWIRAGWEQMDEKSPEAALKIWQPGIRALPDQQLLASLGVFSIFSNATAQLKKIGRDQNVFLIRAQRGSQTLYFVLAAQNVPANIIKRQITLASLKARAGIKGVLLANEAVKFKSVGKYVSLPAKPKTLQKRASRKLPASKPVRLKSTKKTVKAEEAEAITDVISFTINSFDVSGNTLVSIDRILIGLRDYYGSDMTVPELDYIRKDIVNMYHLSGYQGVDVKIPQQISNSTVTVLISEDAITEDHTLASQ